MRILVVGAGGIGGYFGGRLLEAKREVTFLVRPARRAQLAESGLRIRSPRGDVSLPSPPTVLENGISAPFDLVLLSCKAYDLEAAIASFAPAVGPETTILPLLNGMRHVDVLFGRFGAKRVLGGQCVISVVLEADGTVHHLNNDHSLSFGELDGSRSARTTAVEAAFSGARFQSRLSGSVLQDMWEKWVFIATGAGGTCLMRAAVGDIAAAHAVDLVKTLLAECAAIAARQGFPVGADFLQRTEATFTAPGSMLTASMLRDIENHRRIEADHIIGDLLERSGPTTSLSLLRVVYAHLEAYEARRAREASAP
ncbi:MAG: 2-dehydropantoate 2-reductase [Polyangiaceae bacterium]|jgi:2-dehydropantoate 2-reductase